MKKNNKGFTLVELIVVLVILAILAAILVPALLGWIDKAREKSVTTNAEAAYVATQGLITERYGSLTNPKGGTGTSVAANAKTITFDDINTLADISDAGATIDYTLVNPTFKASAPTKSMYKIATFTYTSTKAGKRAKWENGAWTVEKIPTTP